MRLSKASRDRKMNRYRYISGTERAKAAAPAAAA